MKNFKYLTILTILLASMTLLTGCGDDKAEEAGEKIDEMVTDAGNAVEDACEDVKEGVKAENTDC
jgi:predicted small secreted protein